MDIQEGLNVISEQSKKYLESITAFKLMQDADLFMKDLNNLVIKYHLPASIIAGCLMSEIERLNRECTDLLLDDALGKAFISMRKYMDENFMKKE